MKIETFLPNVKSNYEINERGEVTNTEKDIVLIGARNNKGRWIFTLRNKDGTHSTYTRASLMAMAFLPEKPDGGEVDHINNDKSDDRLENLQWLSPADNVEKFYLQKGVHVIPIEEVQKIREEHRAGKTWKELAARYNKTPKSFSRLIKNRKR